MLVDEEYLFELATLGLGNSLGDKRCVEILAASFSTCSFTNNPYILCPGRFVTDLDRPKAESLLASSPPFTFVLRKRPLSLTEWVLTVRLVAYLDVLWHLMPFTSTILVAHFAEVNSPLTFAIS
jgi:hypothetical protein